MSNHAVSVAQPTFTVLPNLTLEQRIIAGNYRMNDVHLNSAIRNFPDNLATIGKWKPDLYRPKRGFLIFPGEVKIRAEVDGWSASQAEHLIAFGEAYPDELRNGPIVALGPGLYGGILVLEDIYRRYLNVFGLTTLFPPLYRYLRVREVENSVS
jgi:hypothetical protein